MLSFQLEREVFLREQANKMYSPACYFIAKNVVETPFAMIAPLLWLLIIYWACGLTEFWKVYLVMLLISQASLGIGLTISSMAPNVTVATAITPAIAMPLQLFGGTIANTATTPAWIGWVQWLSPIRYGNEALGHTQFDNSGSWRASAFMETEGFTIGYWKCIGAIAAWTVFWRVLSMVVLTCMVKKTPQ